MTRLLLTRDVAVMLSASPDFVRAHAAELGGVRLGNHARGPLRFEEQRVEKWIASQRIRQERAVTRRRPGRQRSGGVALIPLPSVGA